jgi:hypothetical protein
MSAIFTESNVAVGQHWKHKKRGSTYEIVAIDAAIQISSIGDDEMQDMLEDEDWIVYRSVSPIISHRLYFRMREEFLDGRFERVEGPRP